MKKTLATFFDCFNQQSCYKITVYTSADLLWHRFRTVNKRRHYARPDDDVIARVTLLGLRRRWVRGKRAGRRCCYYYYFHHHHYYTTPTSFIKWRVATANGPVDASQQTVAVHSGCSGGQQKAKLKEMQCFLIPVVVGTQQQHNRAVPPKNGRRRVSTCISHVHLMQSMVTGIYLLFTFSTLPVWLNLMQLNCWQHMLKRMEQTWLLSRNPG